MSTAVLFSDVSAGVVRGWMPERGELTALTDVDLRVLGMVAESLTNPEISARMQDTVRAVRVSLERLGVVLGASDRAAIVAQAYRWGLLSAPCPVPDGRKVLSRELFDVLLLIAVGLSNAGIAERMGLTVDQVKGRVSKIMFLLSARGREHTIRRAVDLGVLRLVPRGSGL